MKKLKSTFNTGNCQNLPKVSKENAKARLAARKKRLEEKANGVPPSKN